MKEKKNESQNVVVWSIFIVFFILVSLSYAKQENKFCFN